MNSRGLRVLVLGLNYPPEPTGIAPYTAGMAEGLQKFGHRVEVLTAFPHYPQWQVSGDYSGWVRRESFRDVKVTRVRHYVPGQPNLLPRALSELSFGARVVTTSWGNPDVVICVSPALLSSAMAVIRATVGRRRPSVGLVMQDLYTAGLAETGAGANAAKVMGRVERAVARRVDGVVVIHDRLQSRVEDMTGLPPGRVRVIRNWTHISEPTAFNRAEIRRRFGWGDHEVIVLHSGAMGEKQALGNVVAAARIADQQLVPVRFVLLGDGGQRQALLNQADGARCIQFVDPLPASDYASVLRSADVLLLHEKPGIYEMALPSKLTSYFSTGLPVLAATEPSSTAAQEVRAAGAGVVVKPGRPDLLLAAARSLGDEPDRGAAIGARGPSYCAGVLSETAAMDAYDSWVWDLAGLGERRPV